MLSLNSSLDQVAKHLAARIRGLRLRRGWSRAELGARAGVALPTLRKFEDTGKISLLRLLKLAAALDFLADVDRVAADPGVPGGLDEFEARDVARRRQRGRTLARPSP